METKSFFCINCGLTGHNYDICSEPVTSYGIINIKIPNENNEQTTIIDKFSKKGNKIFTIRSDKHPQIECIVHDNVMAHEKIDNYIIDNKNGLNITEEQTQKFKYYKSQIRFLMMSRRFSLGVINFIRGKYEVDVKHVETSHNETSDIANSSSIKLDMVIKSFFEYMTQEEINFVTNNSYDDILYHFNNRDNETQDVVLSRIYGGNYGEEYKNSKCKFNYLKESKKLDLYAKIKPKWPYPEWGFPKGRREKKIEENIICANREFIEETGYDSSNYTILNKIEPVEEIVIGTNGNSYRHVYFLALDTNQISVDECHKYVFTNYDKYEVGQIKWFSYDEAIAHIRPYHVEKRKIITNIYLFIMNSLIQSKNI